MQCLLHSDLLSQFFKGSLKGGFPRCTNCLKDRLCPPSHWLSQPSAVVGCVCYHFEICSYLFLTETFLGENIWVAKETWQKGGIARRDWISVGMFLKPKTRFWKKKWSGKAETSSGQSFPFLGLNTIAQLRQNRQKEKDKTTKAEKSLEVNNTDTSF